MNKKLNKRRGMFSRGVAMLHDNTRPYTAAATQDLIATFGWEQFDQPSTAQTKRQVIFMCSYI
jgi:hypothetical protein